eukprot:TRINITY_DN255_c0_g1_i8.p1 TRINITY_DN255_c0_g1~~TRINITY_DN255_c0_g1_i8.p1  ORF type:complete len:218 (-),score=40.48 TRINITY_DN255_c0_g1_i8:84-737(-)
MAIMNDYICDLLYRIVFEAANLATASDRATLGSREIQTATRLVLMHELAKHAVSEGTKAVTKYNSAKEDKERAKSQSVRSGLVFPVARLKNAIYVQWKGRIAEGAPVYLAAVLEYMCAELLELAGNATRDSRRVRILPRHIQLAVRNDEELNNLLRTVVICGGGTISCIHYALLPCFGSGDAGDAGDDDDDDDDDGEPVDGGDDDDDDDHVDNSNVF